MAARELRREGHRPTVFEQSTKVGGVWVYTDKVEESLGNSGAAAFACLHAQSWVWQECHCTVFNMIPSTVYHSVCGQRAATLRSACMHRRAVTPRAECTMQGSSRARPSACTAACTRICAPICRARSCPTPTSPSRSPGAIHGASAATMRCSHSLCAAQTQLRPPQSPCMH